MKKLKNIRTKKTLNTVHVININGRMTSVKSRYKFANSKSNIKSLRNTRDF